MTTWGENTLKAKDVVNVKCVNKNKVINCNICVCLYLKSFSNVTDGHSLHRILRWWTHQNRQSSAVNSTLMNFEMNSTFQSWSDVDFWRNDRFWSILAANTEVSISISIFWLPKYGLRWLRPYILGQPLLKELNKLNSNRACSHSLLLDYVTTQSPAYYLVLSIGHTPVDGRRDSTSTDTNYHIWPPPSTRPVTAPPPLVPRVVRALHWLPTLL